MTTYSSLSKGLVDYNGSYLYPKGEVLEYSNIGEFLSYHKLNDADYYKKKLYDYMAEPESFGSSNFGGKQGEQVSGVHNHLVVNYPKYLVDTLNGFFTGIPPTIKTDDDKVNQRLQSWLKLSDFTDELSEVSKQASLYGKTYLLIYNNENSETKVTVIPPYSSFMIYDDSVSHTPLAFVQYQNNADGSTVGTIYEPHKKVDFEQSTGSEISVNKANEIEDGSTLIFDGVPAVEFYDNEERTGIADGVRTLIDSVNKTLSNKADDVDYFADAYLFIKGFQLSPEDQIDLRSKRIIQAIAQSPNSDVDARFLEKPNADTTQEHLLERATNLIFQLSMVANINDEVFGNATSGRSLEYKLLSMRNLTSNKERKFTKQMRRVFSLVSKAVDFSNTEGYDISTDLTFQFIRNLPNNNSEEAQTASLLNGIVSHETQLSTLSIVPDPKAELKKIAAEQAEQVKNAVDTQKMYAGSDSESSNQQSDDDNNNRNSGINSDEEPTQTINRQANKKSEEKDAD